MVFINNPSPLSDISDEIHRFLNGGKISKLLDFVSVKEDTVAYVVGCFFGVAQGIDFMFDEKNDVHPRFVM
jgi:hypothetical protein